MPIGLSIGIPRPGHRASGGNALPPFVARALSWTRGDSAIRTAGLYDSLAEGGTLGGSFTWNTARPVDTVQFADLKHVPSYTGTQRMRSTLAVSAWNFLHDGTRPFTLSGRVYFKTVVNTARVLSTFNGTAALRGIALVVVGGFLTIIIGNGTATTSVTSAVPLVAKTWYTFAVTYAAGIYTIQVNTETPVSGAHTVNAGAASTALTLGNDSGGAVPLGGFLAELTIHDIVLNAAQLTTLRSYYAQRWSSVPGVVFYVDADNGLGLVGGLVATWADRAVGNNLADNGAASRPSLVSPWRNGMNALQFDGSNDNLGRGAFLSGDLVQPSAIYHVAEAPNPLTGTTRIASYAGVNRNDEYIQTGPEAMGMYGGTTKTAPIVPTIAGLAFASYAHFSGVSSGLGLYASNGTFHTVAPGDAGTNARSGIWVGSFAGTVGYWGGKIALVMLVDHVPSTAGHNEIITANRTRYNI